MVFTIAGGPTLLLGAVGLALFFGAKVKSKIDNQLYIQLLRILLVVLAVMLIAQVLL